MTHQKLHHCTGRPVYRLHHEAGVASILAMMFLVIFGSLAAAMAIVAQGNLATADTHLKINRSLAAADTGMRIMRHHLDLVAADIRTREGTISATNAAVLWDAASIAIVNELATNPHNMAEPYRTLIRQNSEGNNIYQVHVGPIAVGPNEPTFEVTMTPHPLYDDDGAMIDYDDSFYDRRPYDGSLVETGITWDVSNAEPLDERFVRIVVTAYDGPIGSRVYRSVQMDYAIDKKIRFAILSRSRVMVGQNVQIQGPIGSTFREVDLDNGHPVQMQSDFINLHAGLDNALDALTGSLVADDTDGDNRLNIYNPTEVANITEPEKWDLNQDGYIDEYDMFLDVFDNNGDAAVSNSEMMTTAANTAVATELFELIDTFKPDRNGDGIVDNLDQQLGYNDGVIDNLDRYVKVRGEIYIDASMEDWNAGAANDPDAGYATSYRDYFSGGIDPSYGENALTFNSSSNSAFSFEPSDFNTDTFRAYVSSDVFAQAGVSDADDLPTVSEEVPYASEFPYDYYDRPVIENRTFTNVLIPPGANILFRNCTFIGVVFVESNEDNDYLNYNYAGMTEPTGDQKHPDKSVSVGGSEVFDTKTISNNIRFENCTFEGAIVTDAPEQYTHVRNKLTFTGDTSFRDLSDPSQVTSLTEEERQRYARSSILAPHYSVEMGVFTTTDIPNEKINLSGTIVAGLIDMRGNIDIRGTILTTFEPESNTGPVIGETSPDFNTTLGYFTDEQGDLEVDNLPTGGLGKINLRYDPTLPLPDGIDGPIEIRAITGTYHEGGQQ